MTAIRCQCCKVLLLTASREKNSPVPTGSSKIILCLQQLDWVLILRVKFRDSSLEAGLSCRNQSTEYSQYSEYCPFLCSSSNWGILERRRKCELQKVQKLLGDTVQITQDMSCVWTERQTLVIHTVKNLLFPGSSWAFRYYLWEEELQPAV